MSGDRDALDRLRAANPVPREEAPTADSPRGVALFEQIVATGPEPTTGQRRRRRSWDRRWLWILVPAAIAVGAAGIGLFRDVSQPFTLACYGEPSLEATVAGIPGDVRDPVAACGSQWAPGGLFNPDGNAVVPPLIPCVTDHGSIAVFPDTLQPDTCSALGLSPYQRQGVEENSQYLQMFEAVTARFAGRCPGSEEARGIVEEELASSGLSDWSVVPTGDLTEDRPCASLAFDAGARVVLLVPKELPASP